MTHTLILNSDGAPLSMLPLSTRTWQKAIHEIWTDQAQVLHEYEDWAVHSPSTTIQVPSVIMLKHYRKPKSYVRFSPRMLKLRDRHTCAYCNDVFRERELTLDHVQPKSRGGPKNWENIVAACYSCNQVRGANTRIRPNWQPYRPNYWDLVAKRKELPLVVPHVTWTYYIDWPDKMLQIRER